jgi:hypothetical protein
LCGSRPTHAIIAVTNALRLLFSGAATFLPFRSRTDRTEVCPNSSQQPVWIPPSITIGAPLSRLMMCAAASF